MGGGGTRGNGPGRHEWRLAVVSERRVSLNVSIGSGIKTGNKTENGKTKDQNQIKRTSDWIKIKIVR